MVAVTHTVPASPKTNPLLLAALLLGSTLVAMPVAQAQAGCIAKIEKVTVSPSLWVDGGTKVTVRWHVINVGAPPPVPQTAKIKYTFKDAEGGVISQGTTTPFSPPQNVSKDFTVPANAAEGEGTIDYFLTGEGQSSVCLIHPGDPKPGGTPQIPGTTDAHFTLTYWIGKKPDVNVTGVALFKHYDADPELNHTEPMTHLDASFTRYPVVNPGPDTSACIEENEAKKLPSTGHFNVTVKNNGSAEFWQEQVNHTGDAGGPFTDISEVDLRLHILDNGQLVNTSTVRVELGFGGSAGALVPDVYSLVNKAGVRNITITADPTRLVPETDEDNNVFSSPEDKDTGVYIMAPELEGTLTITSNATKGDKTLTGHFGVSNTGDRRAGTPVAPSQANPNPIDANICNSRNGREVVSKAYLDKEDNDHLLGTVTADYPVGASSTSDDFKDLGELSAGPHRVILVVDWSADGLGNITELNETNSRVIVFYNLSDERTPSVFNVQHPSEGRTGAKINITGNVTDDADFTLEDNIVILEMTFPDGNATDFPVPHSGAGGDAGYIANNASNAEDVHFWFNSTYDQVGTYTFRVRAVDGANHSATFPLPALDPLPFRLTEFPKSMELMSVEVCKETVANQTTNITGDCVGYNATSGQPAGRLFEDPQNVVRVRFKVPPGATGLGNESRNVSRKFVEITNPDGLRLGLFPVIPLCWNNATGQPTECLPNSGESCQGNLTCYNHTFQVIVGHTHIVPSVFPLPSAQPCVADEQSVNSQLRLPATWNLTFHVGDAACKFRAHKSTEQLDPVSFRFGLWDTVPANITGVSMPGGQSVAAGTPAQFRGDNVTDNIKVKQVAVHITKGSLVKQFNLTGPTGSNANLSSGNGTYSGSTPTGIYTDLDLAGSYDWLFIVRDANHTLSYSNPDGTVCVPAQPGSTCTVKARTFSVQDTRVPSVSNPRVTFTDGTPGDAFQAGTTVLLRAEVDDDTRITVVGVVKTEVGGELLRVNMTRVSGALYTSGNLTTGPGGELPEGAYRFSVEVTDSAAKQATSADVVFRVVSNLPPSFTQRTPADGGFGSPNGTVSVDVGDNLHGVLTSSVEVRVGLNTGLAGTPASGVVVLEREKRADGVPLLLRVSFQLQGAKHGDNVTVNVSATDTTNLTGSTQWSFRLDGIAPRSQLSCTRSHPLPCGSEGPQAVRGDTVFTISAQDLDPENKERSGVASVRFAMDVAGQPGQAQTIAGENASFKLTDFAAQDGFYTVRFRAVDNAGNEEPERRLVFALDTQGPQVQNVLATATSTGWNVTATISDASDVRAVRLFTRAGASEFQERPMTRIPDTSFWSGTIAGAARGVQVCYYIEGVDFLDNLASNGTAASPICLPQENHPPQLTVQSPRSGDIVGASLTVRWEVRDIDGDPVRVSIAHRRQGDVQFTGVPLTTEEQGSRTKVIDTAGLPAGSYVLRVDATDNQPLNNRTSVSLNISLGGEEAATGVPRIDKATIAPGEVVRVTVDLPRLAEQVQARLLRGDQVIQQQDMEQDPPGSRTYVAEFRIAEPGLYQVEVVGEYEDGTPFAIKAARTITVTGGFLGLGVDAWVMVVLAAAVVALAVAGLRRRGAW